MCETVGIVGHGHEANDDCRSLPAAAHVKGPQEAPHTLLNVPAQ
jgi:hypothetical protein